MVVSERSVAERIVNFMNVEADTLKAQGREKWLYHDQLVR